MAVFQEIQVSVGMTVRDAFTIGDDYDRMEVLQALSDLNDNEDSSEIELYCHELDDTVVNGASAFLGRIKEAKAGTR